MTFTLGFFTGFAIGFAFVLGLRSARKLKDAVSEAVWDINFPP